jgi:glycosyltransferase involved in cell wall biosynthesis
MVNPWDLRPWELLGDRYDVSVLIPRRNQYDASSLQLDRVPVRTVADTLPPGRVGEALTRGIGERYLGLGQHLRAAEIVHGAELGFWFTHQAALLRERMGFRLAVTVWETIPFADAYRNLRTRRYRRDVLAAADVFLPTTQRAATALGLEGVPDERITICAPGVDLERFAAARTATPAPGGTHLILSAGRLVWEKGHQDVLRAAALLHGGEIACKAPPDVRIVGAGPEAGRLRSHADELGIGAHVEIGGAAYRDMPAAFAEASALALMSLPLAGGGLHPGDVPRVFWEEQFGMVFAEALAAGLPIVAADSGAIREVLGDAATFVAPGDWRGLAEVLAGGVPAPPADVAGELVERYSLPAAAQRLAAAYRRVLS